MENMTNAEQLAIDRTTDLWAALVALDVIHPDDINEHRRDVHNIQNRILSRTQMKMSGWGKEDKKQIEDLQDERYCDHCEKDTQHTCRDSQHERDSSQDYQECLECGWWMTGLTGGYNKPI